MNMLSLSQDQALKLYATILGLCFILGNCTNPCLPALGSALWIKGGMGHTLLLRCTDTDLSCALVCVSGYKRR